MSTARFHASPACGTLCALRRQPCEMTFLLSSRLKFQLFYGLPRTARLAVQKRPTLIRTRNVRAHICAHSSLLVCIRENNLANLATACNLIKARNLAREVCNYVTSQIHTSYLLTSQSLNRQTSPTRGGPQGPDCQAARLSRVLRGYPSRLRG